MPIVHLSRARWFDPATGQVVAATRTTRLEPQPAALLALLARRPDTLVSHAEIHGHLWSDGRHVDYAASVHYAVRQIRRALDDGTGGEPDIESLPRRGYRLRAASLATASPAAAAPAARRATLWRDPRLLRWSAAVLFAVAMVTVVERRPNRHHEMAVALVRAVHDAIY